MNTRRNFTRLIRELFRFYPVKLSVTIFMILFCAVINTATLIFITEKIPAWIRSYSHSEPEFSFTSGGEFPDIETLRHYTLIVHCGGCMLNQQEMTSRLERAKLAGVPIVNYGAAIAQIHGILQRSLEPLPL